ncbi:hypothetical protein [Streptomyces sp. NRRL B-24484]|uniref:hypothetical protein n=1 Tax=Streptomyces sp. NRRL B-24484 TaxID=1463833 RepID=UPI0004C1B5F6|nr:hypothetical protein [Streptomyces sp. NRRL B-24484]
MLATAERTRPVSQRWALLPMGGVLLVAAAVFERVVTKPRPQDVHVLCTTPAELSLIGFVAVPAVLLAGLVCALGVVHLVVDPPARIAAPLVYVLLALTAVVGADGLDRVGAGIATAAAADFRQNGGESCDYPIPVYRETPGWFF